jgi:hypothetical protein
MVLLPGSLQGRNVKKDAVPGQASRDARALELEAAELLGAAWIAHERADDEKNAERVRCALILLHDETERCWEMLEQLHAANTDCWESPAGRDVGEPASDEECSSLALVVARTLLGRPSLFDGRAAAQPGS